MSTARNDAVIAFPTPRRRPDAPPHWNPYVACLDHETVLEAIQRHRRQTGHGGYVVLVRLPRRAA